MILCLYISGLLGVVYMIAHQAGTRGNFWFLFISTVLFMIAHRQYDKLKDRVKSLEEDNKRFSEMWKYQTHINDAVVDITKNEMEE